MLSVKYKFLKGFPDIDQGHVFITFLWELGAVRVPAVYQFFDGSYINAPVMQIIMQLTHVFGEELTVLTNGVAA